LLGPTVVLPTTAGTLGDRRILTLALLFPER
jgi:hypothetical protein